MICLVGDELFLLDGELDRFNAPKAGCLSVTFCDGVDGSDAVELAESYLSSSLCLFFSTTESSALAFLCGIVPLLVPFMTCD